MRLSPSRRPSRAALLPAGLLVAALSVGQTPAGAASGGAAVASTDPIKHVVVVLLENHSFDNVLGPWCARTNRCSGTDIGDPIALAGGKTLPLGRADDYVAGAGHARKDQDAAFDGGRNDGWLKVIGCAESAGAACLTAYEPDQVPNITQLAARFAVHDRTESCDKVPSWADHVQWFTGCDLGGFLGDTVPHKIADKPAQSGVGWGCDSASVAEWGSPTAPRLVPSCFPDYSLPTSVLPSNYDPTAGGAYKKTPVQPKRTLGDNCAAKPGCSWTMYGSTRGQWNRTLDNGQPDHGYIWNIASSFAQNTYPRSEQHTKPADNFQADARRGALPSISFLLPMVTSGNNSQHNKTSMALGDNVLGQQMATLMSSPQWKNTAVFITYDDCGCFYDHVSPARMPMVVLSPWVRPGTTDRTPTTFAGVLRFMDKHLGLPDLTPEVTNAYDYADSFDFTTPARMGAPRPVVQPIPARSLQLMAQAPVGPADDDDS